MFDRYRKGATPADFGLDAFEDITEAPSDDYEIEPEDGDNSELLDQFEHLVSDEQIAALETEQPV